MNFGAHKKREPGKRKLSDINKIMINTKYEYLDKEPPFMINRWAGSSTNARGEGST